MKNTVISIVSTAFARMPSHGTPHFVSGRVMATNSVSMDRGMAYAKPTTVWM